MDLCVLLSLSLALSLAGAAPLEAEVLEQASCTDPIVLGAAGEAMNKINQDRSQGYVFSLHNLADAHLMKHGENSIVFYLKMNILQTNCSVLSKTHYKNCQVRDMSQTPVYGQCKAVIFISSVHRVVRLYKYDCVVRPVAAEKVHELCPDCPSLVSKDSNVINKTVSLSLEKFNNESGLVNHFKVLEVTRARAGMGMGMFYSAEYTIQETTCGKGAEKPENCPLMDCEFAHKGFCKGSNSFSPMGDEFVSVDCEIYEPEAAVREEKLHLLGGETDHSHNDTHAHDHAHYHEHGHDHVHDHTKSHSHHDKTHKHGEKDQHHHSHDHQDHGAHRHAHDHSHDHGHGHDHVHAHHAKAHDHSKDSPNHHHQYAHASGTHTHEHDHEIALDHDHKHAHLHMHEHHHHHHMHKHETMPHDHPEGSWREIPALGQPMTLPAFPDTPAGGPEVGVPLPLKPDPQIPGQTEPSLVPFPTQTSAQCTPPLESTFEGKLFLEDPEFKPAA